MMEGKTIRERMALKLTEAGAVWDFDPALIPFVEAKASVEFGDDLAYNPETQIVVSREAGKAASETIERCLGDGFREYFDCDELDSNNNALAELRAALEVQK